VSLGHDALLVSTAAIKASNIVELHVTRGRIVIEPSEKLEYDLDVLVMGMNAKNKHDEASFGAPIFAAP
jgi:antitoxin MazE